MEDDPDAADDERIVELSSIAAIYPELIIDPSSPHVATLELAVTPTSPLRIRFKSAVNGAPAGLPTPHTSAEQGVIDKSPQAGEAGEDVSYISHLPPVCLRIDLPEGYPTSKPPIVTLSTTPPWISKGIIDVLQQDSGRLWEELGKDQVVYTYIDHVQQAAENGFAQIGEAQKDLQLSADMKVALLDFDLKTKREAFEKETFDCGICLEPKKGVNCHRLILCSHVFCVTCLQDFYNNCITEGDVDNVKCLDPSCEKMASAAVSPASTKRRKLDRTLNPSELLQIELELSQVQRYVRLKRKKKLESDKSTVYCPRQWCQGAARSKKHPKPVDLLNDVDDNSSDSEAETDATATGNAKEKDSNLVPMSERLSICEDCNFAFCSVCKKGWHGELSICNPRKQAELNEEEKASLEYMQRFTTACPTCSAPAQKTMGCNHMICFKCRTHFCYLCSAYLLPDNPYEHYNQLKSTCYMRLWELEGGDGIEAGQAYGGAWVEPDSDDESDDSVDEQNDEENDDFEEFNGDDVLIDIEDNSDSDDEEPAPDVNLANRQMRIEIVPNGADGRHIIHNIPHRPVVAPPAAPAPPPPARDRNLPGRGRRPGHRAIRQLAEQQAPHRPGLRIVDPPLPPVFPNARARWQEIRRLARLRQNPPDPLPPRRRELHVDDMDGLIELGHEGDEADARDARARLQEIRAQVAPGQGNAAAQQPAPLRAMDLERFLELAQLDREDEWDSDE